MTQDIFSFDKRVSLKQLVKSNCFILNKEFKNGKEKKINKKNEKGLGCYNNYCPCSWKRLFRKRNKYLYLIKVFDKIDSLVLSFCEHSLGTNV